MKSVYYGFHSAEEVIRNEPQKINQLWVAAGSRNTRLQRLQAEARRNNVPIKYADVRALNRLAGNDRHQGVVLEVSPYRYSEADDLLENVNSETLFLLLDEIQDTTNLANLLRTAEGAGVSGVFLPERRSAAVTETTQRLSAGALEHLRIARVVNLAQLIENVKERGVRIICADASAQKLWHQADYTPPVAILVGNEFKGVRRLLKEKSDELVRIPMLGKIQSLNVGVAAAILLYEAVRWKSRT